MEYASGGDLAAKLRERGPGNPFPVVEALQYMREVLSGVQYLHDVCKVVHRDIKLENIFLNAAGRPLLGDLGLGRTLSNASVRPSRMSAIACLSVNCCRCSFLVETAGERGPVPHGLASTLLLACGSPRHHPLCMHAHVCKYCNTCSHDTSSICWVTNLVCSFSFF